VTTYIPVNLWLRVRFLRGYRNVTQHPYPCIPVTGFPWCYLYPCHILLVLENFPTPSPPPPSKMSIHGSFLRAAALCHHHHCKGDCWFRSGQLVRTTVLRKSHKLKKLTGSPKENKMANFLSDKGTYIFLSWTMK
jgi:hypothetical protein